MSLARHQPPVHSPVAAGALLAALRSPAPAARAALAALLREKYGAQEALLYGSGTQALQRALELALAAGDVVALPAYTCPEVASAAIGAGLRIALYDVDPATLAPEAASLERLLARGVRVLVAAPLYGVPLDWMWLSGLASRHGVLLVEDAAQGLGASWRGQPLGSLGERSIISFGRGKGWTGGGGGALLLRGGPTGVEPVEAGGSLGAVARAAGQALLSRPGLYGVPRALPLGLGETRYHAPEPPVAMPGAAAALVVAGRRAAEAEAEARRRNAAWLLEALQEVPGVQVPRVPDGGEAGWLRLPVLLSRGLAPADAAAARKLGVERGYPRTLGDWPEVGRNLAADPAAVPGAERLARELITLPTHSLLRPDERLRLVRLLGRRTRS